MKIASENHLPTNHLKAPNKIKFDEILPRRTWKRNKIKIKREIKIAFSP